MSLDAGDPRLAPLLARLAPHARALVLRAGEHALRLHADAVTPDHLLTTLMDDSECAAHRAVIHAFADPATISGEALAISPGILVVASASTLPFSPRAAAALRNARARAARARAGHVGCPEILVEALREVGKEVRELLEAAGLRAVEPEPASGAADPVTEEGPLFKRFSMQAKRALSGANRAAAEARAASIGPAHVVLGCLREDEALAARAGLGYRRARIALAGRGEDASAPAPRRLPPDPSLLGFLAGLEESAGSLDLLARFLAPGGTPELGEILLRQKLSAAVVDRSRAAFRDP